MANTVELTRLPPVDPFHYDRCIQRARRAMRARGARFSFDFAPLEDNYPPSMPYDHPKHVKMRRIAHSSVYAVGGWIYEGRPAFPYHLDGDWEWSVCEEGVLQRAPDQTITLFRWDEPCVRVANGSPRIGRARI